MWRRAVLAGAAALAGAARTPAPPSPAGSRPRVVVLGTGWSAFAFLRGLERRAFDVTVVSPRNHMLFTPLLSSTAAGSLEFRSIAEPVVGSFADAQYVHAAAVGVDPQARRCRPKGGFYLSHARTVLLRAEAPSGGSVALEAALPYDALVVAVGAGVGYFGVPGAEAHALPLKELRDARAVRQRLLRNIEAACLPGLSDAERQRLASVVVVGGGPTGCELAAELHDLMRDDLARLYPHAVMAAAQITLVEAGAELLSAFDASLRAYALQRFRREGVAVRAGVAVARVGPRGVVLADGSQLSAGLVVWSAGLAPRPLLSALDAARFRKDKWGHLVTSDRLKAVSPSSTAGEGDFSRAAPGVWALGDCAAVAGGRYAATAQVAEQQGAWLAAAFNDAAADAGAFGAAPPGREALAAALDAHVPRYAFTYRHRGSLAMLGSLAGAADFTAVARTGGTRGVADVALGPLRGATLRGAAAWLLWRSAYLTRLGRWRNRLQVPADWARAAIFGRDTTLV